MKLPSWLRPVLEIAAGVSLVAVGVSKWADSAGPELVVSGSALTAAGFSSFGVSLTIAEEQEIAAIVKELEGADAGAGDGAQGGG